MEIPQPIIHDKKALLTSQIPSGIKLKCKLKRRKDLLSFLSPEYDFYLESGFKHLLSAQKQMLSQSKVFKLSMDVGQYSDRSILCNLQCNALHNHYLLIGQQDPKLPYRLMYGEITYGKLKKSKQPRDMDVILPFRSSVGVKLQHMKVFTFEDVQPQYKLYFSANSGNFTVNSIFPSQSISSSPKRTSSSSTRKMTFATSDSRRTPTTYFQQRSSIPCLPCRPSPSS